MSTINSEEYFVDLHLCTNLIACRRRFLAVLLRVLRPHRSIRVTRRFVKRAPYECVNAEECKCFLRATHTHRVKFNRLRYAQLRQRGLAVFFFPFSPLPSSHRRTSRCAWNAPLDETIFFFRPVVLLFTQRHAKGCYFNDTA